MSMVLEVVEDFDAAVARIAPSADLRMQRRALREALGHLYTLREYRSAKRNTAAYYAIADSCVEGRTTKCLMAMRNALIHDLTKPVALATADKYIDTYTDMYGAPVWLKCSEMSELPDELKDPARVSEHDSLLAAQDQDVIKSLGTGRRFLVEHATFRAIS